MNGSLRKCLREWLRDSANELLDRTDPDERRQMTAAELEAETKEHGACAAAIT